MYCSQLRLKDETFLPLMLPWKEENSTKFAFCVLLTAEVQVKFTVEKASLCYISVPYP